jgi:hypothetical protein
MKTEMIRMNIDKLPKRNSKSLFILDHEIIFSLMLIY